MPLTAAWWNAPAFYPVDRRVRVLGEPARPRADHRADHRAHPLAARRPTTRRSSSAIVAQRTRRVLSRVRADPPSRRGVRRGASRSRSRPTACRTRSTCSCCRRTGCRWRSPRCTCTSRRRGGDGRRSSPSAGCCRRSRAATTSSSSRSSSLLWLAWFGRGRLTRRDVDAARGRLDRRRPACSRRCCSATDRSTPSTASSAAPSRSSTTAPTSPGLWSASPDSLLWGRLAAHRRRRGVRAVSGPRRSCAPAGGWALMRRVPAAARTARGGIASTPSARRLMWMLALGPRPALFGAADRRARALCAADEAARASTACACRRGCGCCRCCASPCSAAFVDRADRVAPRAPARRRRWRRRAAARRLAARLPGRRGAGHARDDDRRRARASACRCARTKPRRCTARSRRHGRCSTATADTRRRSTSRCAICSSSTIRESSIGSPPRSRSRSSSRPRATPDGGWRHVRRAAPRRQAGRRVAGAGPATRSRPPARSRRRRSAGRRCAVAAITASTNHARHRRGPRRRSRHAMARAVSRPAASRS